MDVSPQSDTIEAAEVELKQEDYENDNDQYPQYEHYPYPVGEEGQCRKQLPATQEKACSPSEMSSSKEESRKKDRSTGKKRVMFQDQQIDDNIKKDLFAQSDNQMHSSQLAASQDYASESEPQSLQKYPGPAPDYDHFHDESMSKLEAVLQRQRERLENLGGFSGKSSQISNALENEENLEEAYQDLEEEIKSIKKNLEASQTSENYSPMKLGSKNMDGSRYNEEMDLSPSDLYDE